LVKVNLEVFEGPLDLLLFLIRKNEIDIHDIPIAKLTQEYVATLDEMEELDLNVAGEFLVMAAQLMVIKSRMMLPVPETAAGEEGDAEDPRSELVARLLEYQQFKEAAHSLGEKEMLQRDVFGRMGVEAEARKAAEKAAHDEEGSLEVNLFDLLRAFQRVLDELPDNVIREIEREEVTVVQKINEILDMLEAKEFILFHEAFAKGRTKVAVLATFLAMLELAKMRSVLIRQSALFSEIHIYKRNDAHGNAAPAAEAAPAPEDGAAGEPEGGSQEE
jgi:segregation and condensation protein A